MKENVFELNDETDKNIWNVKIDICDDVNENVKKRTNLNKRDDFNMNVMTTIDLTIVVAYIDNVKNVKNAINVCDIIDEKKQKTNDVMNNAKISNFDFFA